ncbi:MAG: hypothetical protein OXE05_02730 [Chloroflexi bacterium]|nr:hypothetical protein [Chloroflexota bacterium]
MWRTVGHGRVLRFLQRAIAQNSLGHAILFAGPQSVGKRTLAIDLTAALLCNVQPSDPCWECVQCKGVLRQEHADLHMVELEEGRKSIRMEQVAELQRAVALRPFQAAQRVSLILDAHLLQPEASQRLLKTLEEPPAHNTLILTATSTQLLPQTLLSRCQVWRLAGLPRRVVQAELEQRGVPEEDAAFLAAASMGRMGWAIRASAQPDLREQENLIVQSLVQTLQADRASRTEIVDQLIDQVSDLERLFDLWCEWWRSFLLLQVGDPDGTATDSQALGNVADLSISSQEIVSAIKRIDEAREWVRANVNARLALETLVLHLPEAL